MIVPINQKRESNIQAVSLTPSGFFYFCFSHFVTISSGTIATVRLRAHAIRRVLATVKCQAIGGHATLLIGRQSDMSRPARSARPPASLCIARAGGLSETGRWKYRRSASARRVFPTLFARSKSVKWCLKKYKK